MKKHLLLCITPNLPALHGRANITLEGVARGQIHQELHLAKAALSRG